MPKIKNIHDNKINVLGEPLEPKETREVNKREIKRNEIKTLLYNDYIEEVKEEEKSKD